MSEEQIRQFLRRFYEALDSGDADTAASLFHPGVTIHLWDGVTFTSREEFREWFERLFSTSKDAQREIKSLEVRGDTVEVHVQLHATHNGQKHTVDLTHHWHFRGNRVTEVRVHINPTG
nr:LuxSiti [synthetic construct]